MASQKKKIPPKFWVTCVKKHDKPHKFGYDPEAIKSYLLRLKDEYAKAGMTFSGVIAMLDHAQEEISKG